MKGITYIFEWFNEPGNFRSSAELGIEAQVQFLEVWGDVD